MTDALALRGGLGEILGERNVIVPSDRIARYFRPPEEAPGLIAARPGSLEEVQKVVRLAHERKVPILTITDGYLPPSDANRTGVVLDFGRMNTVDRLDKQHLLAHVWRGLTWGAFREACAKAGVRMPTPVAATSDSVLTNIVGRNPLKHVNAIPDVNAHSMRVVLSDGRLHRTGAHALKDEGTDLKDDGGPSLSRWYFGSDDIFGIVCRAAVYVYPRVESRIALCFAFPQIAQLILALRNVPRTGLGCEYIGMNARTLSWVLDRSREDLPDWAAVVGFAGESNHVDYQVRRVAGLMAEFGGNRLDDFQKEMTEKVDEVWVQACTAHTEFYSAFDRLEEFHSLVEGNVEANGGDASEVGRLLLVHDRGRCACALYDFFDLDREPLPKIERLNLELAAKGAFFNRPQGNLAGQIYKGAENYERHLRTIKSVVDPDFLINPGRIISRNGERYVSLISDESFGDRAGITVENLKEVKEELARVVGGEWVSDNPADLIPYSRDFSIFSGERPNIVALPKTIGDVQHIMRVAYDHGIPVVPQTSGFNVGGLAVPRKGGILVDLRRIARNLELDEEAMTATIDPTVRIMTMWSEVQKVKTYKDIHLKPLLPLTFGSVSMLSNYVSRGVPGGAAVKYGNAPELTLAMTWVLPNGEVLRTGPSAFPGVGNLGLHYGPGPDVGGMFFNADGAFGICVEATVKLYPEQPHESLINAAAMGEDGLEMACQAIYTLSQTGVLEFIMKTHPGIMAVLLADRMGLEIKTVVDMLPENAVVVVVNGFDEEEVRLKEDIVREAVRRLGLVEVDLSTLGEGFEDLLSTDPTKKPWGLANNTVGAHKGSFHFVGALIRLSEIPKMLERYQRLTAKYWKTSDPNITLRQAMTGSLILPLPYARCSPMEVDFWYDQGNPENVKRATQMIRKTTELVMEFGGLPTRNMFGLGELLIPRLGVYTEILKGLRKAFDPENLMHPDVLPVTDDYV